MVVRHTPPKGSEASLQSAKDEGGCLPQVALEVGADVLKVPVDFCKGDSSRVHEPSASVANEEFDASKYLEDLVQSRPGYKASVGEFLGFGDSAQDKFRFRAVDEPEMFSRMRPNFMESDNYGLHHLGEVGGHVGRPSSPGPAGSIRSGASATSSRSMATRERLARLKAAKRFRAAADEAAVNRLAAELAERRIKEDQEECELALLTEIYEQAENCDIPGDQGGKPSFRYSSSVTNTASVMSVRQPKMVPLVVPTNYPVTVAAADASTHLSSMPAKGLMGAVPRVKEVSHGECQPLSDTHAGRMGQQPSYMPFNMQSGPQSVNTQYVMPRNDAAVRERAEPEVFSNAVVHAGVVGGNSEIAGLAQLLAEFQKENRLPKREPKVFNGSNIEDYVPFIEEFSTMIESSCSDRALLYSYLVNYTSGEAGEIVRSCFSVDRSLAYDDARAALERRYGNAYLLAHQFLNRLKEWPAIKRDGKEELRRFSVFLMRIGNMCRRSHHFEILNSGHELKAIADKLPSYLVTRWGRKAYEITERGHRITFKDLVDFVEHEANVACQPYFGLFGPGTSPISDPASARKRVLATAVDHSASEDYSNSNLQPVVTRTPTVFGSSDSGSGRLRRGSLAPVTGANTEPVFTPQRVVKDSKVTRDDYPCWGCGIKGHRLDACQDYVTLSSRERDKFLDRKGLCLYCRGKHMISKCNHFKSLGKSERRGLISGRGLCFACWRIGHRAADCSIGQQSFLKDDGRSPVEIKPSHASHVVVAPTMGTMSPTVVVDVQARDGAWVRTRAALDAHSSVSFIDRRLAKLLGLAGRRCEFKLTTFSNIAELRQSSAIEKLRLRSVAGDKYDVSLVYSVDSWPFQPQDVPSKKLIESNKVLSERMPDSAEYPVGILIGMDEPQMVRVLESIDVSADSSMYASRFQLGWAVCGGVGSGTIDSARCNRVSLEEHIRQEFARAFEDDLPLVKGESVEDCLWRRRVNETLHHRNDGQLEIGLPFRENEDQVTFPYNYYQALGSLGSLSKRFLRDSSLAADYKAFMSELIECGIIEEVPCGEIGGQAGKIFFLCHHAVYHRTKQKIRVVFDCSRKCNGVSLNDKLLQGPNLMNRLVGVLLRFRSAPVAVVGDIRKMFLQLRVPRAHRDYMRILWWPDGDSSREPRQHRLTSHTFGAVSSPSLANFAVKWAAEQQAGRVSDAALRAVDRCLYVDDFMCCFNDSKEAAKVLHEVSAVLSFAGFHLVGLASNSREVLRRLEPENLAADLREVDLVVDELPAGRVLGMYWDTQTDFFSFRVEVPDKQWTKRSMLSVIGSLFDPLGFLLPLVVAGRTMFQQVCRLGGGWDDLLPSEVLMRWMVWLDVLPSLRRCNFPRCVGLISGVGVGMELHIFCDGSQTAYAAVAYARRIVAGKVESVHLLKARSRQTPVGKGPLCTVPRIELNAARLAVELAISLKQECDVQWSEEYFWTDSSIVLAYLRSLSGRFQRFVANRISFIRSHSEIDSWRFIPGKLNVADVASRGSMDVSVLQSEFWVQGPRFLKEVELLVFESAKVQPIDLETCKVTLAEPQSSFNSFWDKLFANLSCWKRMRSRVAVLISFLDWLRTGRRHRVALDEDVWQRASRVIWKGVQSEFFRRQVARLSRGLPVHKGDILERISPFIDTDGLLKTAGRLGRLEGAVRPPALVILPRDSRVVTAYVRFVHCRDGHFGGSFLRAAVGEKFHVFGLSSLVKSIVWRCVLCRKAQGRPLCPKMADLPLARVEPVSMPFVRSGVDIFGPLCVKERRSTLKRYGVVFSCLTTRAVHFEVVASLTKDAFVNCLRRFESRRGKPVEIFCDNGTNLVGASRELAEGLKEINNFEFLSDMARKDIKWNFRPPGASHWGGSWEREIRTARKVLWSLLAERPCRLTDELLNTLMCEVELIMNRRPLTPVQAFSPDMGPLTPMHLLMPGHQEQSSPCLAGQEDKYYVKRWRAVQYYADEFWVRWRKEYLPLIKERAKWVRDTPNLRVGDMVLLTDAGLPRFRWSLGVVSRVYPGADDVVRKVDVRVAAPRNEFGLPSGGKVTELLRPVNKLIPVLRVSDDRN